MLEFNNGYICIKVDLDNGIIEEFKVRDEQMNWFISSYNLNRYGYSDAKSCLLGKSVLSYDSNEINTGEIKPSKKCIGQKGVNFIYNLKNLILEHSFELKDDRLSWRISVKNVSSSEVTIEKLYHWMPVAYIMHETIAENLNESCSFSTSLGSSKPYAICKKRSGIGKNMIVINQSGEMKSSGSLCKYKNLFFEKSAPSLSGLVLFNTVNAYKNPEIEQNSLLDWQYRDMYRNITLESDEVFEDSYDFAFYDNNEENESLLKLGVEIIDFPHIVYCNESTFINSLSPKAIKYCRIFGANIRGVYEESDLIKNISKHKVEIGPFTEPGERKMDIFYEDGSHACAIFAVYNSTKEIVEAFCDSIYTEKFIDDEQSDVYCAYKSVSRQGEACAKGSLLLMKNLVSPPNIDEIRQAEKNAAYYLRKRWLNDDFVAIKQYPGGFARIYDMDYLIVEFYLLSCFEDSQLSINTSDTYLMWAYYTAVYRFEDTPDKLPRENEEVKSASIISWFQMDIIKKLQEKGLLKESEYLKTLYKRHIDLQLGKIEKYSFIETEHYFDNAGISVTAETLLNEGYINEGMKAARLLIPNVSRNNDYRNVAPDRWWEALACMYHNLWCVLSAKAILTAYEKTLDSKYLFTAYDSMVPMFYNYDWNVVSSLNNIKKGDGVSTYCITSPNLNLEYASRNRFGQSVFKDEFFAEMDLAGDDWDLGMDLLVYLCTFGQTAYVTKKDDKLLCVNGCIVGSETSFNVKSHAAYPARYFFESLNMSIIRGSCNFTITSITMENNQCKKVEVQCEKDISDFEIYSETVGKRIRIYPEVIVQD